MRPGHPRITATAARDVERPGMVEPRRPEAAGRAGLMPAIHLRWLRGDGGCDGCVAHRETPPRIPEKPAQEKDGEANWRGGWKTPVPSRMGRDRVSSAAIEIAPCPAEGMGGRITAQLPSSMAIEGAGGSGMAGLPEQNAPEHGEGRAGLSAGKRPATVRKEPSIPKYASCIARFDVPADDVRSCEHPARAIAGAMSEPHRSVSNALAKQFARRWNEDGRIRPRVRCQQA